MLKRILQAFINISFYLASHLRKEDGSAYCILVLKKHSGYLNIRSRAVEIHDLIFQFFCLKKEKNYNKQASIAIIEKTTALKEQIINHSAHIPFEVSDSLIVAINSLNLLLESSNENLSAVLVMSNLILTFVNFLGRDIIL